MSELSVATNPDTNEGFTEEIVRWGPLDLVIEFKKGMMRPVGDDGYTMFMHADYGYIESTVSMETGDALDVFMNPDSNEPTGTVFVIGMLDAQGAFEEEKVFLNFNSLSKAEDCFRLHYGAEKLGYAYVMRTNDFIAMVGARALEAELKNKSFKEPADEGVDLVMDVPELPSKL